jgi:hypothetical protein
MHTQVVTAFLACKGVAVHRVHDARAALATLALADFLDFSGRAGPYPAGRAAGTLPFQG